MLDELVPQLAEDAEGEHGAAVDVGGEISQHERRAAEPAELLAQRLFGERMLAGFLRRAARQVKSQRQAGFGRSASIVSGCADGGVDDQIDGGAPLRIGGGERLAQAAGQFRVVVLPDAHAGLDLRRSRVAPWAKASSTMPSATGSVSERPSRKTS